jgi:hypothetical protein
MPDSIPCEVIPLLRQRTAARADERTHTCASAPEYTLNALPLPIVECDTFPVTDAQARLVKGVERADLTAIRDALAAGANVNALDNDGASVILYACLAADADVVRLLLDEGADPNARADEPAASTLAETPLDLVMQAQIVLDWEKYTPIYELLVARGAVDADGAAPDSTLNPSRRDRALTWQSQRNPRHLWHRLIRRN